MFKLIGAALAVCAMSMSSFALFTNGGFETGDFTGWNVQYGTVQANSYNDPRVINWGTANSYQAAAKVIDATNTNSGQTLDVNPYVETKMAMINDIIGMYNATRIWQEDAITQTDIDNGGTVYVDWGAMLVDPGHPVNAEPLFGITVSVNGVAVQSFTADASQHAGWALAGSDGYEPLYYKAGQWSFNLSSFNLGDNVKVEMFVADCGWGGHGGYAFLDGIGTIPVPNPSVPEPGMLSMLIVGMLSLTGFAASRKRK
jgi:hypothetical protein